MKITKKILCMIIIISILSTVYVSAADLRIPKPTSIPVKNELNQIQYSEIYNADTVLRNYLDYVMPKFPTGIDNTLGINTLREYPVPCLMYHMIADNANADNPWVLSTQMLEEDFKMIKSLGFIPITMSDYIKLVEDYKKITQGKKTNYAIDFLKANPKIILITVDDGYKDGYTKILPLLKKYNFKATFYLYGEVINNNKEYLNNVEIKEMWESGLVEFGNHTYSLHKHSKNELKQMYSTNKPDGIYSDIMKTNNLIYDTIKQYPTTFSYPYGESNSIINMKLVEKGFTSIVTTENGINKIGNGGLHIMRINRSGEKSSYDFFKYIISLIN